MDDFNLAGTEEFIQKVITQVEQELTVSKREINFVLLVLMSRQLKMEWKF